MCTATFEENGNNAKDGRIGQLTERNHLDRVATCISLVAHNKTESFLKRMVTGDEKWILCKNPLSVRWNYKKIFFFELLS